MYANRKDSARLVIESDRQQQRIISTVHDANHLGLNRTYDLIYKKYYWPSMYKEVSTYVKCPPLL